MTLGEQVQPARRRFPPQASSVGEARRMIRGILREAGREDLLETAELVVSEIVTNALVHAGTSIDVAVRLVGAGLRIEVTDGSPHLPTARGYGPNAGTGRGLLLLEQMVDEWGVVAADSGKTVWFQIDTEVAAAEVETAATEGATVSADHADADVVEVVLLDVPLLLHQAWRQHAESLLREYLLASLDLEGDADPIAVHAEASDAIALLGEHVPESPASEDGTQVLVTATEPQVTAACVVVPVPRASVAHFATLERAINTALSMVEDGLFLTPPTQPEVQGLRSWLCAEVRRQAEGHAPTPWSTQAEPPRQVPHRLRWDVAPVRDAETGLIAADAEDRIVAVSRPVLDLLGYDEPGDLVGHRLVAIIPARYRQAHLAGFTLQFLTGRSTLLGRTVEVPALARDGSEVPVLLTVGRERTDDGGTVFVASMDPADRD